jgi:uncharacterized OB-fold protein
MSPVVPGFEGAVPYACVVVELDEQPELLVAGNLVGADPTEAVIGRRVEVAFETFADDVALAMFRLSEPAP